MKTLYTTLFLLALCSGCSNMEASNKEKASKMFDAFNQHDWKTMSEFYHDDALFLDPSFGKEFVSKKREETAKKYNEMEQMFPDIHDAITSIHASGDIVTVEFTSTGKANDSVSFSLPIVTILTFKDGMIVRDATYYDM